MLQRLVVWDEMLVSFYDEHILRIIMSCSGKLGPQHPTTAAGGRLSEVFWKVNAMRDLPKNTSLKFKQLTKLSINQAVGNHRIG